MASANVTEIDLDGRIDEATGIRYIGKATKIFDDRGHPDGSWLCLADVGGALCRVELRVAPTIHVDKDPGDEDDRASKDARLARHLGPSPRRPR